MAPVLSTVLFASAAAAQITTSMWLPIPYGSDDYDFQASIVGADGDRVTMAIEDASSAGPTNTITFHGSTSFENIITTSDSYGDYEGDMTVSYGCSKRRGTPVCVVSSNGPVVWSAYCADYTSYVTTETYTFDSPPSTVEQVATYDYLDSMPDFCSTGSLLPERYAVQTISASDADEAYLGTYAVTITAGEQKLSATAGATPSNTPASSTPSRSTTPTNSLSSSPTNSGSNSSVPSPTTPAQQSTNAASAPMKTVAPILAGMGAFVAAVM